MAILLVLSIGASTARAQTEAVAETEARETFKSLFGQELDQVTKTSSTADDVKLAGKLLGAVGTVRSQPELMALICEKAYDLGRKNSNGYDVALEAMGVLAASSPGKKAQCLDKVVSLHQLRYARSSRADRPEIALTLANAMINACDANAQAGNIAAAKSLCMRASRLAVTARLPLKEALRAKYKELVAAERAFKRIAGYKARLKADPSQITPREALINIYLIERNDPVEAAKWLNEDCDERLRTYIPLAAGDIIAVAESTLMEMGDWYKSLAASAQPISKGGLLLRSLAFYEKFLEKHTTLDLARTKAVLAVTRVKADIKKYGAKVPEKTTIVTTGQLAGVSRKASVLYPQTIAGLKAWTVEPRTYLGRFYDVEFLKDSSQLITAGQDGAIRFWDVETGKLVRVLMGHDGEVRTLAWSSDRKTLASGSSDKTVRLWDPVTGKVTNILRGSTAAVRHLAWSPDSMMLACAGSAAKSVGLWSVKTGRTAGNLKLTNSIRAIAWGPESSVLATATEDGLVSLWNARTRRSYGHYPLDPYKSRSSRSGVKYHRVNAMAWSPASTKVLAVAISTGKVKLWKSRTKRTFIKTMMPINKDSQGRNAIGHPSCIEWSPDGKALAVSDSSGFVWFWNPTTGKMSRKFRDSTSQYTSVSRIAWSPDGNLVATASSDSASNLIEAETGEVVRKIRSTLVNGVIRPEFSSDAKLVAYPCDDNTIRIWDIEKCKQVSVITVPKGALPAGALRWSPDSARIAYFARSNYTTTVRILDVKSGVLTSNLAVGGNDLVWSPDSAKIVISQSRPGEGKIGKIQVWDVATPKALFSLSNKKISSHYGLKISPDGKTLVSTASRGRVFLWSLADQKIMRAIPADEQSIRCIAFSPDGKKLASCGSEKIVKIWSVDGGKPLFGLRKHESEVYRVAFSPDGTKLVSAGSYGYLGVWDLATGKNTAWFRAPNWQVRWMKDSKTLAAANKSGVYFYNAAKGTRKASYRPMPKGMGVLISAGGHYSGTPGVEKNLIYQAVGLSGQSTLTQEEFGQRFGWKNDPSKVKLLETSDKSSK
ncbi:MAG: WD40 repeat domain-containing protein [Phycisphaerae bacterium]|nr:WD40 repeat domain-containing protein [Phycisphaerae bacterium]